MLRVFIGYDPRQAVSFTALAKSIVSRASLPVAITPLVIEQLPIARTGLTPFTYSRFLVPWLCGYAGWALFLDVDMLALGDVAELFGMAEDRYAVMVAKNDMKFEWASAMLFNNPRCRVLTPRYVETAERLHTIAWANDSEIGALPPEWNHLVGYDAPRDDAKLVHFTQGVPAYPETEDCEYGDEWRRAVRESLGSVPWAELMGNSVHDEPVIERLVREGKARVVTRQDPSAPEKKLKPAPTRAPLRMETINAET